MTNMTEYEVYDPGTGDRDIFHAPSMRDAAVLYAQGLDETDDFWDQEEPIELMVAVAPGDYESPCDWATFNVRSVDLVENLVEVV